MKKKQQDNNKVTVIGVVEGDPVYSHKTFGEGFYRMQLVVIRYSERYDEIPLIVSERLFEPGVDYNGKTVVVNGQFRSHNETVNGHRKLVLTVFAKSLEIVKDQRYDDNINDVFLEGYVCRTPVHRVTPTGKEITDIFLAVNRDFNKSDYLPCICWGRNAKFAERFRVGEKVQMWGRVQSRDYVKYTEGRARKNTVYEVSVDYLETSEEN